MSERDPNDGTDLGPAVPTLPKERPTEKDVESLETSESTIAGDVHPVPPESLSAENSVPKAPEETDPGAGPAPPSVASSAEPEPPPLAAAPGAEVSGRAAEAVAPAADTWAREHGEPSSGDVDEERTVVQDTRARQVLQRLRPPGHSEVIPLQLAYYTVGRSTQCSIRLFSETASRRHAHLLRREGVWYLEPEPGKTVIVDGTRVEKEIRLRHRTLLEFGDDALVYLDPGAALAADQSRPPREGPWAGRRGLSWVAVWVVLGVVSLLVLAWILRM